MNVFGPRSVVVAVSLIMLAAAPSARAQQAGPAAEIVGVQGAAEFRPTDQVPWAGAVVKQELLAGQFVRTGELSRMGLLFADQTQIRLNQNSLLQVKQVASRANDSSSTVVGLVLGRAWSQSKQAPKKLLVQTPSATAAIRGTDWELSVDAEGTATLTVLSGEVEFYNDFGSLVVATNQQASARVGQAPVRLLILNPRDRVQWVTAYAVDPLRHISLSPGGPPAQATLVSAANELADLGRWTEAKAQYTSAVAREQDNAAALAGLGFAAIHDGDAAGAVAFFDRAERALGAAAAGGVAETITLGRMAALIQSESFGPALSRLESMIAGPDVTQPAAYLLLADLMLYIGETDKAIEYVTRSKSRFPDDARLESQLARILLLADRGVESRAQVDQALLKAPRSVEAHLALGDLARVDGDPATARAAYLATLALKPADARAWYGLGALNNEREEIRPGRRNLARAIELNPNGPGYAGELGTLETFANRLDQADRAYRDALDRNPDDYIALTGKALLELKRGADASALELLLRATLMEPKYARAHMYMAVAYYRTGRIDRALEELDRASELDPKDPFPHMLKSIVHGDVLDPASAIDAGRRARDLMPYLKSLNQLANNQKGTANLGNAFAFFGLEEWANSLAQDSYYPYWAGSHLFLGDRYPGLFNKNSEYFQGILVDPTAFGGSNRYQTLLPKPDLYLSTGFRFSKDGGTTGTRPYATLNGSSNNVAPAAYFLDIENSKLRHANPGSSLAQNGLTAAVGTTPSASWGLFAFGNFKDLAGALSEATPLMVITKKLDVGAHYRVSPTSVLWAKVGGGRDRQSLTDRSNPIEHLQFTNRLDSHDVQVRHTVSVAGVHELSWGAEIGDRHEALRLAYVDPADPRPLIQTFTLQDNSEFGYVSDRVRLGSRVVVQGDLFVQRYRRRAVTGLDATAFLPFVVPDDIETTETTRAQPRVGGVVALGPGRLLRAAYQRWGRPASVSTLSPVATAGIPLDDQLVRVGGVAERYRAQLEWEWTPRTFTLMAYDRRDISNPALGSGFKIAADLNDLLRLRVGSVRNTATSDLLEGSPEYGDGTARTASFAINHILTRRVAAYSRYFLTDSENTGAEFRGNLIPYLPRHLFSVGATFAGPHRLYASGQAVRRSARFTDEANTVRRDPEWRGTVRGFWELPSKRWLVGGIVDNLFSPAATAYGVEVEFRY